MRERRWHHNCVVCSLQVLLIRVLLYLFTSSPKLFTGDFCLVRNGTVYSGVGSCLAYLGSPNVPSATFYILLSLVCILL